MRLFLLCLGVSALLTVNSSRVFSRNSTAGHTGGGPAPEQERVLSPTVRAAIWLATGNQMPVQVRKASKQALVDYYLGKCMGTTSPARQPWPGFDLAMDLARDWCHSSGRCNEPGIGFLPDWYRYRAVTIEAATWISSNWPADQIVAAWASKKKLTDLARRLFGKGLGELAPWELAFVAVRRSPHYDWFCKDAAHAKANRDDLLNEMHRAGLIEGHQRRDALQAPLPVGFVAGADRWPCDDEDGMCGPNSDRCRIWGQCSRGERGCLAGSDSACTAAWACKGHGRCVARNGRCVAAPSGK